MAEREKQKLQVWSRIMPYRQSFAWTIVPLFENNNVAAGGGAASPSSPLAPSVSGSSSQDSVAEHVSKMTLDGKLPHYSSGSSVIVEISNINKVKESYTEDLFQVISQHKSADSFIFYFLIVLIGISFSICTLKYLIACFFLLFCDSM